MNASPTPTAISDASPPHVRISNRRGVQRHAWGTASPYRRNKAKGIEICFCRDPPACWAVRSRAGEAGDFETWLKNPKAGA